jgi:hypothetical protein
MRRVSLKITQSRVEDTDDRAAMSEALTRLYRAASQNVGEIVANLSASERARLAVFCYGRVHLNAVGLAIAADCELDQLVAASNSATAGHTLFVQSREAPMPANRPFPGRRQPVTLATSVPNQFALRTTEPPAELPA